jgi:hypothetical protein
VVAGVGEVKAKSVILRSVGLFTAGLLIMDSQIAIAETDTWDSALTKMRKGSVQMIEGAKMLRDKKDLGSAEKTIKHGHRMMMEAEKATAQIQKETLKQGARKMLDGLKVLKSKKDPDEAEKLMGEGQEMILEGERMMADTRPGKLMQGSRTMMRGFRMMQAQDMNTAHKLMMDGQTLMMETTEP